jgi:hypothetical protein
MDKTIPKKKTKTKQHKDCKAGKVLNSKTGRCIKDKTKQHKDCPAGKVRNSKTGRCIKDKTKKRLSPMFKFNQNSLQRMYFNDH